MRNTSDSFEEAPNQTFPEQLGTNVVLLGPTVVQKSYVDPAEAEMAELLSRKFPEFTARYYGYNSLRRELLLEYVPDTPISNRAHLTLVVRKLLQAITKLHTYGFVHRDLTRSNFSVTPMGIALYDYASIMSVKNCNLDILGHHYTEDYEEKGAKLAPGSGEMCAFIRANTYFALGHVIRDLRLEFLLASESGDVITQTEDIRILQERLLNQVMQPERVVAEWLAQHGGY